MANAFGFNRHPQGGTPDPTQVGQALMQRTQQAPRPPMAGGPMMQPRDAPPAMNPDEMMRSEGARLMTSGQGENSALAAAIGEALTREGGGFRGNPNPNKPTGDHMRRLQALGLSETEAMLLGLTGGV